MSIASTRSAQSAAVAETREIRAPSSGALDSRAALRVLHVIASISPARGGPSLAVRNVVEALRRRGVEADIVTTNDDGPAKRADVAFDRFVDLGGQRVRYFPRQTNFYGTSLPLLGWLMAHVRDYHVVHTHGLYGFVPIAGAMVARAARIPYVMRPAGMLDRWGLEHRRRRLKGASIRWIEGPLLQAAARVHFVSEHESNQAFELGLPIRPLVLPLGLDLRSVAASVTEVQRRASPVEEPAAPDTVLYLSRIDRMKGIDSLVHAFAQVARVRPNARLVIAGDGPSELVSGLRQLADRLAVSDRVSWPGFVQGVEKVSLYRHSAVFVLPSQSENFGIAVAEAMAAGLPVVVTHGVALSGLVASTGSGIVTDGSAATLGAAIERLLGDEALRTRMGTSGRRAVDEHLSLDAFGGRLERLYRSLVL